MSTLMLSRCPSDIDERIELYCLNRLPQDESRALENHLAVCPACFEETLNTDWFLESLVAVLKEA